MSRGNCKTPAARKIGDFEPVCQPRSGQGPTPEHILEMTRARGQGGKNGSKGRFYFAPEYCNCLYKLIPIFLCLACTLFGSVQSRVVDAIQTDAQWQAWRTLHTEHVVEISATDKEVRPIFVGLQGIIEQALAEELQISVKNLKGIIHTPMPATPLCTKGEISKELIDPSIENDPARLATVKARTAILRDFLFKGGDLYICYPKAGFYDRTPEQQQIYLQELSNYPTHLFDTPLERDSLPLALIGATYFFETDAQETYVFSIKMTQAKDPQEIGHFGLWFGPITHPAIEQRLKSLSEILDCNHQ
ncbi:MAG: hypothetical protein JSS30_04045 [Verrucomicrobia bacterium]|nr:hypothetical protein [Verrucomicrobiota bacterium]